MAQGVRRDVGERGGVLELAGGWEAREGPVRAPFRRRSPRVARLNSGADCLASVRRYVLEGTVVVPLILFEIISFKNNKSY